MGGKEFDHKIAHSSLNTTSLVSKSWSGRDLSFESNDVINDVIKVIQGQNSCQIKNLGFSHNL